MTTPTPTPPFVVFLAVSGSTGGGALYFWDDESGRRSAVNVLFEVTDSTGLNVFGPQSETVPLNLSDAKHPRNIFNRIEDTVLSRLTANAGGPAQLVIGVTADNVSFVWVTGGN